MSTFTTRFGSACSLQLCLTVKINSVQQCILIKAGFASYVFGGLDLGLDRPGFCLEHSQTTLNGLILLFGMASLVAHDPSSL